MLGTSNDARKVHRGLEAFRNVVLWHEAKAGQIMGLTQLGPRHYCSPTQRLDQSSRSYLNAAFDSHES
jgi:hypothetical protein